GYLYFPWKVADRGLVQLCSGCLMERNKPYVLPIELARGTLNRLRNQAGTWQTAGMVVPTGFFDALHTATTVFAHAATGQNHPQAAQDQAEEAVRLALDAADVLCQEYAQQVLAIRRTQQSAPGILLGARLHTPPTGDAAARYLDALNMVVAPADWPELEPRQGA